MQCLREGEPLSQIFARPTELPISQPADHCGSAEASPSQRCTFRTRSEREERLYADKPLHRCQRHGKMRSDRYLDTPSGVKRSFPRRREVDRHERHHHQPRIQLWRQ